MSSYQKFTLAFFRKRLQDGAYANATGANRAIGKTRELTEAEKESARALVRKHFGDDTPAPAKKEKPPVKKAAGKPAAKVAKKASKRAKPGKTAKKQAKSTTSVATAGARGKGKKKSAKRAAPPPSEDPAPATGKKTAETAATKEQRDSRLIELMGTVVTTLSTAVNSMEASKDLFPKVELEAGVKSAQASMARAVRIIDAALAPLDKQPPTDKPPTPVSPAAVPPAVSAEGNENEGVEDGEGDETGSA